jgi:Protein of unknown function (DUF3108)
VVQAFVTTLLLGALFAGAGCAPPVAATKLPAASVAEPATSATASESAASGPRLWSGEHLLAEVSTAGMTVAEYQLWVEAPCLAAGRPALPVGSKAQRRGIYAAFSASGADAISWLDAETGAPLQARSTVIAGDTTKRTVVHFGQDHYDYVYERDSKVGRRRNYRTEKAHPTPSHVRIHDMHSTLALMREWSHQIGTRGTVHTVVGRFLYRVEIEVMGRERVDAGGESYDAIRIDGVARRLSSRLKLRKLARHWSLWLSDEPIRMPVRAQLKTRKRSFLAELVRYQEPTRSGPSRELQPCEGLSPPPPPG